MPMTSQIKASATEVISAPPRRIYTILADYRNEHPQILPRQYFSDFKVVQGGIGEGTVIEFQTHVLGQSRSVRAEITEPEPGHILTEKDIETGLVTTFIVEPINSGQKASVTVETKYQKSGVMGFIERFTAPPLLRRIYKKELQILKNYAQRVA